MSCAPSTRCSDFGAARPQRRARYADGRPFRSRQSQWSYRAEAARGAANNQFAIPTERFFCYRSGCQRFKCTNHNAGYWAAAIERSEFRRRGPVSIRTHLNRVALARPWQWPGTALFRDARDLREDRKARSHQGHEAGRMRLTDRLYPRPLLEPVALSRAAVDVPIAAPNNIGLEPMTDEQEDASLKPIEVCLRIHRRGTI